MKNYIFTTWLILLCTIIKSQGVFLTEATGSPFATSSSNIRGMVSADLNADGKQDIVFGNDMGQPLAVLLGDGSGQFSPSPGSPFSATGTPIDNTIADFNNDGIPDIATADQFFNAVIVMLGTGTGSFTAMPQISLGIHKPSSIDSKDFNMDGKMDFVVVSEYYDVCYVFLGAGNGTFSQTAASPFSTDSTPIFVKTGFLNSDAFPDFVIANQNSNSIRIFLGSGTGTFTSAPSSTIAVGSSPRTISAKDINNDGKTDLVVANYSSNSINILLGQGNGTFTNNIGSPVTLGNNVLPTAIADFNLDGIQDIAVAQPSGNIFTILRGPTFNYATTATIFSTGTTSMGSLCSNDFNGDGIADVIVGSRYGNMIKVFLNTNPIGIKEYSINNGFYIFPNPASTQITIKVENFKNGMELLVYNLYGQIVDKVTLTGSETIYTRNNTITSGTYMLKVLLKNETTGVRKVFFD